MLKTQIQTLIDRLKDLQKDESRGPAAMAAIRRALSGEQTDILRTYEYIGYLLPRFIQEQNDCILVAALFASHQIALDPSTENFDWQNLGTHLAALHRRKTENGESTESLDRRFSVLLAASRTELPYHLRAVVSLLKGAEIPIQWENLLMDVQYWEAESPDPVKPTVQRRWANAYWQNQQI